jgi:hypothetical protein
MLGDQVKTPLTAFSSARVDGILQNTIHDGLAQMGGLSITFSSVANHQTFAAT